MINMDKIPTSEELKELGLKRPYHNFINFPIELTIDLNDVVSIDVDDPQFEQKIMNEDGRLNFPVFKDAKEQKGCLRYSLDENRESKFIGLDYGDRGLVRFKEKERSSDGKTIFYEVDTSEAR